MKRIFLFLLIGILISDCYAINFVCAISPLYVKLFNVDSQTRKITIKILMALAFVFTAKVFNMVVGGGVLQSGGQTKFMTIINIIGPWLFIDFSHFGSLLF